MSTNRREGAALIFPLVNNGFADWQERGRTGVKRRLAEGGGFEPPIRLPVYTLSKRAPSATRPPLQKVPSLGVGTIIAAGRQTSFTR